MLVLPMLHSRWIWQPGTSHEQRLTVLALSWNGEEYWVVSDSPAGLAYNELDRFWEAVEPCR